jgi:hypothetical protein
MDDHEGADAIERAWRDGLKPDPLLTVSEWADRYRVIARRPDTIVGFGETRVHVETATFELRASQVANPRSGDQLTIGGDTFVVQGEPERRDPDRLVWTLDVRRA